MAKRPNKLRTWGKAIEYSTVPYSAVDTGIPCQKLRWKKLSARVGMNLREGESLNYSTQQRLCVTLPWHLSKSKAEGVMIGGQVSSGVWDQINFDDEENLFANNRLLGPIIGIDLGTSNSCVSLWHPVKNRAKVVKNIVSKSKCSHYMRRWIAAVVEQKLRLASSLVYPQDF